MAAETSKKAKPARKKGPIQRLHPWADGVRAYFFSDKPGALVLWIACIVACAAILVWFYSFTSFGGPTEPVYAGF